MDCVLIAKNEGLQRAKTLHIFSKISEISVTVKENLAVLAPFAVNPRRVNRSCTQNAQEGPGVPSGDRKRSPGNIP
jgi:hypothetical protein